MNRAERWAPLVHLLSRVAPSALVVVALWAAVELPPRRAGALCAGILAACALVLVYRWGVREGERRAGVARHAPQSTPAPAPAPQTSPVAPAAAPGAATVPAAPAAVLAPQPAPEPPRLVQTEPYPQAVELAELGELHGVQSIRMRLVLEPGEGRDTRGAKCAERDASPAVQVAGRWVDLPATGWDVGALAASAREPGGYYLGNCGCGVPECSSVMQPVQVLHEGERITWRVPMPYARASRQSTEPDAAPFVVSFDAAEYRQQAAELVQALRDAAADGGPLVRVNCYPGELPSQVLAMIDEGGAGWGGREPLRDGAEVIELRRGAA